MSKHSNQARASGPSTDSAPAGANPTYKTHLQRDSRTRSSTSPAGDGNRRPDLSVDGAKRTTKTTVVKSEANTNANNPGGGFGDGHYVKN